MVLCIGTWVLVICINLSSYGSDNLDYLFILLSSDGSNAEFCTCNTIREFAKGKALAMRSFCKRTQRDTIIFTRTNCSMCFFMSNMPEFS